MSLPKPRSRFPKPTTARRAALAVLAACAWLVPPPPAAAQHGGTAPDKRTPFYLEPVDRQPRLENRDEMTREIAARYPPAQREAGVASDVLVGFKILPDGSVDSASVSVEHALDTAFAEPAAAVARRLRFDPRRERGRPAGVWQLFPVHFDTRTPPTGPGAPPDDTWELWSVDEQPGLRYQHLKYLMNGWYPSVQRDSGVPGDVLLRFRVMSDGTVDPVSLSVLQATNAAFVEPAMEIARELRFMPARIRGRSVAAWFTLPLHFRITPCEELPDVGTYELSAVEVQPTLVNGTEMTRQLRRRYPTALRDSLVSGDVTMRFKILADGTVEAQSIAVESTMNAAFGEAARPVIAAMRFTPAKVDGCPVRVWVTIPISFGLVTPPPAQGDSARSGAATPPAGARP